MMSRRLILVSTGIGIAVGMALIAYGLIFDPFSIPFQDYDQLPLDVQLAYEQKNDAMKSIRVVGLVLFLCSLFTLVVINRTRQ
jgi:hypothetical protein